MKRFLVLGIGNAQVDLLQYLRAMGGIEVHAVSYNTDGRAFEMADKFELINIADRDQVLSYVIREKIDYIYSVGSDIAMPTASWVAEKANLPHYVNAQTAEICNNKHELRAALKGSSLNLAFTYTSNVDELDWNTYPAMLKPVDSQGQRGVFKVTSRQELEMHFSKALSFSRSGKVIIEEFVDGPEYSINLFLHQGKILFSQFSDREVWNEFPGGIIKSHKLPCSAVSAEEEIGVLTALSECLASIGLTDGPAYCQMKVGSNGSKVIEITPRLDGCHMWRAIDFFCGVNLLELTINGLLNPDVPSQSGLARKQLAQTTELVFLSEKPGVEVKYAALPANKYVEHYYAEGTKTPVLNGHIEKTGYVIY